MPDGTERRETAIQIGATLADAPVAKDIIVTTPSEIAERGHVVNTVLRSALREGRVVYERAARTAVIFGAVTLVR